MPWELGPCLSHPSTLQAFPEQPPWLLGEGTGGLGLTALCTETGLKALVG